MPERERNMQKDKWKAASRSYRLRKKMANAVLDLTPPSMEITPPVDANLEQEQPQEQVENTRQAVIEPITQIEDFNPLVSSTPEREKKSNRSAEKSHKKLQQEKCQLKRQVMNLRKQLANMRKQKEKFRKREKRLIKGKRVGEKFKPRAPKKLSAERKQAVIDFLSRDENSCLLAGKKDTVTKNKNKMQRRVLTKSLNELHSQFKSEMGQHLAMSYRQFTRRRPFYITEPKTRDRETCACAEHENIRLLISKLHTRGLLQTTSLSQILRSIVCEPKNKDCMDRICVDCCFEEVKFPETDVLAEVSWEQWERVTSNNGEKTFANVVKKTYSGTVQELKDVFQKKIEAIAIHQFNWVHQTEQFRALKERLTETEAVLHVDFSENYACKLSREIQAFHFGGSRKQATIHTAVLYTVDATKSYATLSDSLRHDERAVWAHLEPILKELRTNSPQITTLHIISDGPVTQYRNKANFYLLSTLPFIYGFKNTTWNYSERAHGKGAPDGIGGAVKREADLYVQRGGELQTVDSGRLQHADKKSRIEYHVRLD